MKIIVLAGGLSTERDVSLASAAGICRTLNRKRSWRFSSWRIFRAGTRSRTFGRRIYPSRSRSWDCEKHQLWRTWSCRCKSIPAWSIRLFLRTKRHWIMSSGRYHISRTSRRWRRKRKTSGYFWPARYPLHRSPILSAAPSLWIKDWQNKSFSRQASTRLAGVTIHKKSKTALLLNRSFPSCRKK